MKNITSIPTSVTGSNVVHVFDSALSDVQTFAYNTLTSRTFTLLMIKSVVLRCSIRVIQSYEILFSMRCNQFAVADSSTGY